jgi:hypothetical protein
LYSRHHHRNVAAILESLDGDILAEHQCYFGGGTAIVLRRGEYRESVDIDFLVSDTDGYRGLRELLTGPDGLNSIARSDLHVVRDVRADQYGIRTAISAGGSTVKFEIIHEGRISLELPAPGDFVCGVYTLSFTDMATSKLLANADRWADSSVHYRDVIDLAMLQAPREMFDSAVGKAERAYGSSVIGCLASVIEFLEANPDKLVRAISALKMSVSYDDLWPLIVSLRPG